MAVAVSASAVVVVRAGPQPVERLIAAIGRWPGPAEIVVVNCRGEDVGNALAAHPNVNVVPGNLEWSIARARWEGIRLTTGDPVAVLHERYEITDGWYDAMRAALRDETDVVGGTTSPGAGYGRLQWAMFLTEYAHIAPPMPNGPLDLNGAAMLPGGNVSYRRRVFDVARMGDHLSELDFHASLFRAGVRFERSAGMDARFVSTLSLDEYREERRAFSRRYGQLHGSGKPAPIRVAQAAARLALPPLLLARRIRQALPKPELRPHLFGALPWMSYFAWIQSVEEIAGILTASPLQE